MDMPSPRNSNANFDSSKLDDVLNSIKNILFEDDFGDFLEDRFSYPPSPALTLPSEEVSHEDQMFVPGLLVGGSGSNSASTNKNNVIQNEARKPKGDAHKPQRVAFKTQTKHDVLVDGYRWRKYGKKAVKNSPNLRNYYKCTSEGCQVKKIIERWVEDSSYVITQYDGVHNHESPSSYYYYTDNSDHCQNTLLNSQIDRQDSTTHIPHYESLT